MPIKYLNRNNNSTTILAGNSVQFNGNNQYLTAAPGSSFLFGTSPFTIEMWLYPTVSSTNTGIFDTRNTSNSSTGILIRQGDNVSNGGVVYVLMGSGLSQSVYGNILLNYWSHVAFVRNSSGSGSLYINGTSVSTANMNANVTDTNFLLSGFVDTKASPYGYTGYISNLRVVNNTALYTSNFTPSTSPLTAIANTSLLTCNAATIVDASSNNFTITNNGAATVSSTVPFTASFVSAPSVMKFTNRFNAETVSAGTQKAIFGYGNSGAVTAVSNLVSNTGVVANDTTGVGTAREYIAAAGYGADKAIFGYGYTTTYVSMTNLVSNTGVVSADTTGVGTARYSLAAAGYGTDKAIFGYGLTTVAVSMTNLVSNTGVVATDTTGVGTARWGSSAASYGTDKSIFGYGYNGSSNFSITNLVSNTGVVATDTTGVGTIRRSGAAAGYGTDKAIFGYGFTTSVVSITNLVSNTGVVSNDITGVGTARSGLAATGYGSDKAIFGYGTTGTNTAVTNIVSNTGVVASDTTGVGTARQNLAAAGFSSGTSSAPSVMKFTNRFTNAVVSIVTSGLVLNLDASNASSYPGSGTSWFDLSGNSNTGTLTNGPTFNSANGGSIVFDGTDDEVTTTTQFTNPQTFSIGAWFKTSTASGKKIIAFESNQTGTASTNYDRQIWIGTDGKLYFGLYDNGLRIAVSSLTYNDNNWHYVVATYGGEGTTMRLYVDGSSVATASATNAFTYNGWWRIGGYKTTGWTNGSDGYFTGSIGVSHVYNRGITAVEIQQNYNATKTRFGL